ncbi:hypothetical protein PTKIN_Ptkin03bG0105000 [Pterospermum kingtungense]
MAFQKDVREGPGYVQRLVRWDPPPLGWVALNMDGCVKGIQWEASASGVFRDANVWHGLKLAREMHISCLQVRTDSELVVRWLQQGVIPRF